MLRCEIERDAIHTLDEMHTHAGGESVTAKESEMDAIPEMTATELKERLDGGQPLTLVDVRKPFEREIADLPEVGQHRIPVDQIEERAQELDSEATLVFYCRSGARSERAARALRERGYEQVYNLQGGVLAWRAEVDPSLRAY